MNSLVTALPGLELIFVSAGGVNALAGVLFLDTNYSEEQIPRNTERLRGRLTRQSQALSFVRQDLIGSGRE